MISAFDKLRFAIGRSFAEGAPAGGTGTRAIRVRGWRRRARAVRKVCTGCAAQRALFRRHGIVRWDRYHTLCFRCFRAHLNRRRAAAARRS